MGGNYPGGPAHVGEYYYNKKHFFHYKNKTQFHTKIYFECRIKSTLLN